MKTSSDTVERLTQLLKKVQVIENEIQDIIAAERGEIHTEGATAQGAYLKKEVKPLFPGETVAVNDLVRILNPNKDQQQKGRVFGRTGRGRLGFLRIITPSGIEIRRIGKNVIVLTESEYNALPERK